MRTKFIKFITSGLFLVLTVAVLGQSKELVLTIELDGSNEIDISTTILKYNKDFAFSFCFDDSYLDSYQLGFRLFNGGISEVDGKSYPGLYYSDGCGNQIPFTASIAWITANQQGTDVHNGTNNLNMTYSHALQLFDHGWSFINHSYDHSANAAGINFMDQLTQNDQAFYSRIGQRLKYVIPPSGDVNYIEPAFSLGAPAVFTSSGSYTENSGVPYKLDISPTPFHPIFWRNMISSDNGDVESKTQKIRDIESETTSNNHLWWNEFTHRIGYESISASMEFPEFKEYMENLANEFGALGKDNCLFASSIEVFEYTVIRDNIKISRSRSGNTETVVLDYSSCPDYLTYNDISLYVEGEKIKSISTSSPASISYALNNYGYLINVSLPASYYTRIEMSLDNNDNIEIYPNPSIGKFVMKTNFKFDSKVNIRLIDFEGKTHYPDIRIQDKYSVEIDLKKNTFSPGLYIVIIEDSKGFFHTNKIILK